VTSPPSLPPRGWYPDPGGSAAWRWWDGAAWTDDLEPFARAPRPTLGPLLDKEVEAEGRLVPLGIGLLALALVLGAVVRAFEATYLTATWHWFVNSYDIARSGGTTSAPPAAPAGAQLLSTFVVLPAQIVGLVLLLVFQHRAATAAKLLGFAQRLSPTFGVWAWFIPFASLVLPWMVWQDLLPATHPARRQVTAAWLLYITSILLTIASFVATVASAGAGAAISALAVIVGLLSFRLLIGIVGTVSQVHRDGAGSPGAGVRDLP
jgi:hypothetical protein